MPKIQSEIYLTTDGQSASSSRCQTPIWGPWPVFLFFFLEIIIRQLWVCYYGEPSLTRGRVYGLQLLLSLARLFLSIENCAFLDVWRPLWREDGSVIYSYNCLSVLPEQSLSGPSPAQLTTILYCRIPDSSNIEGQVPVFIPPQNRPSCTPGHRESVLQYFLLHFFSNSIRGLVVRVLGYRSGGPGSITSTTRKEKKSSGSGTGSTQPREYNWGATW
jgi:hypothetical protein